jgi:hypothetical protein
MEQKLNINLIIRMYCDHAYSVEAICLRLRYPTEAVNSVVKKYRLEYGKSRYGKSCASSS